MESSKLLFAFMQKLCLVSGLLMVAFLGCGRANQVFLIQPQDKEVDQGDDVTFRCSVNFLQHDQYLAWFALGNQVTSGSSVVAQREDGNYAVSVIAVNNINLVLDDVQPSDDGMYSCAIVHRHTRTVVLQSRIAILIVNFLPNPRTPVCTPVIATVHLKEFVTITCEVKTGKPPVNLIWTRADDLEIDPENTTLTTVNLNTILTYVFVASLGDWGAIFTCTATSDKFPHYQKSCTVTVDVQFPPKVNITPIAPDESEDFPSYNCTAYANPDATIPYVWDIDPPFPDTNPIISQDGTILAFDTEPICLETTTGTCTASNIKGSGNDTVIICEPPPTPTQASRGTPGDGGTTTIVIIILLLVILLAVLGLCFMYRRKKRREREQLLTSQPPPNINITVDPHININISGAETIARGNLKEGEGSDNLGINPDVDDEGFYLPMGDVKAKNAGLTITSTVSSTTNVSGGPEDAYIDGYDVEDKAKLKPRVKTRKGKASPKPIPKPRPAPRSPAPHPRLVSRKGFVQALKNGLTFRRKKGIHHEENDFDMDDPKADYEQYKTGKPNIYEGLKPHQDTDDENDGIWDDKKKTQAKFVEQEGAYDLAGALRMTAPPSNSEAKIQNMDRTNGEPEDYKQADLYESGPNNAKQSRLQSALLALNTEEIFDKSVDDDYDLVGAMRVKPPSYKSATEVQETGKSRPDSEVYSEAKMYGGVSPNVGVGKTGKTQSSPQEVQRSEFEGEVYAEAKMYGAIENAHNKLEFRKSVEVSQDVDAQGGGFGKTIVMHKPKKNLDNSDNTGKAGDNDSGMIYEQATFYPGSNGDSFKTSLPNNAFEEDGEMYEEPIRSQATDGSGPAFKKKDEPDDELYEEPVKGQTTNADRSAVVSKKDQLDIYEEPIKSIAANAAKSVLNNRGNVENEMLYEKPISDSEVKSNKSNNLSARKGLDKDIDMIYQEATMYGATAAISASSSTSSKKAVFADNSCDDLDLTPPGDVDESIYAEATFHGGTLPKKNAHPKISEKPVVGKKTATLVRNDMDLSEFAGPGDEDGGVSTGQESEEDESVYAEATLYGSIESGRPHKPPVATPRKNKAVAKKSATLVRQDSDDF